MYEDVFLLFFDQNRFNQRFPKQTKTSLSDIIAINIHWSAAWKSSGIWSPLEQMANM